MKVILNYDKGLHFDASIRHFSNIHVDEPESFHGTDLGPSAIEYILVGIGGCLGSSFVYCLLKQNIKIKKLRIIVDGKMKHKGPKFRLRLVNVNIEIRFSPEDDELNEEIKNCIEIFQDHCVVSNPIINGLPIQVNVSQAD